jgi:hypothetical protein
MRSKRIKYYSASQTNIHLLEQTDESAALLWYKLEIYRHLGIDRYNFQQVLP